MNKYTLIPEHLLNYSPLFMLKSELNRDPKGLNLGVKLGREFRFSSLPEIREIHKLKSASQMQVELLLPELNQILAIEANHTAVLIPKLSETIINLNDKNIAYKLGVGLYSPSYLNQIKTDNVFDKDGLEELKNKIDNLFDNEIVLLEIDHDLCPFNRQTFTDFLITHYMNYEDNVPFPINRIYKINGTVLTEKSDIFIPMKATRETLVVFGDGSRENNCIKEEVCSMLYQIKYLLKGVKPLSNQELKKISVRTSQIKKEIGHLGATFDEDVFELLATLEVQIGYDELRNLNYSLRVLIALTKGFNKIELDKGRVIETRNIVLPRKFLPFSEEDAANAYNAIMALTATKEPISGLEAPLNYLRSQLGEFVSRDKFKYVFIDGIVYYLNRKDGTSIQLLRGGWNSGEPIDICLKFIEDAFSKSDVLRNSTPNKMYFLFYILYNIL